MSSYIEGIGMAPTASNLSNSPSSDVAAKDETSMGKEDFLTLLVAQLENQDPLDPQDATEFTAQLAQFSSLEQLFILNESMESLVASNATSDRLSTLSTIGKDVTYHGDNFKYEGNPVEIGYELDGAASDLTLTLQHNGTTIAALDGTELTEGRHFITWDGLTEKGEPAPVGDYQVLVSSKAVDGESIGVAPLIKSEVTGVDMDVDTGGILITQAGTVKFSDILGVYEPGTRLSTTIEPEEKEERIEKTLDTAVAVTESVAEIIE